jgi:hypothetical protein
MKKYYAVTWGTENRTIRWTGEKVASEHDAKVKCFGMDADDMRVTDLGTRKNEAFKKLKTLE